MSQSIYKTQFIERLAEKLKNSDKLKSVILALKYLHDLRESIDNTVEIVKIDIMIEWLEKMLERVVYQETHRLAFHEYTINDDEKDIITWKYSEIDNYFGIDFDYIDCDGKRYEVTSIIIKT